MKKALLFFVTVIMVASIACNKSAAMVMPLDVNHGIPADSRLVSLTIVPADCDGQKLGDGYEKIVFGQVTVDVYRMGNSYSIVPPAGYGKSLDLFDSKDGLEIRYKTSDGKEKTTIINACGE